MHLNARPGGGLGRFVRPWLIAASAMLLCAAQMVQPAQAGYRDLMGYPELEALLGEAVPTGAGLHVGIIEGTNNADNYMPDVGHAELVNKTFTNQTDDGDGSSSHATHVARNFVGSNTSIAPDIDTIDVWSANDWLREGFLNAGHRSLPQQSNVRIFNHSWIGNSSSADEMLRRIDYVVDQHRHVQVVGVPNAGQDDWPLLKDAYNVIAVGRTDGSHVSGSTAVDGLYTDNRVAPTLVATGHNPANTTVATSWATPQVAAGTALLMEAGQDTSLSNGTLSHATGAIPHAQAPQVLKASLMAGADRHVINARGANLTDYQVNTSNNLDSHYGAGQMNIYNSYRILAAGEQDSREAGGPATIAETGWDYGLGFGGAGGSDTVASYGFSISPDVASASLQASLAWNLSVEGQAGGPPPHVPATFDAVLHELHLMLYDVTADPTPMMDASSLSDIHNTQNIYFTDLEPGRDYDMRVVAADGQDPFSLDYALAWQIMTEPAVLLGDMNLDGVVDTADVAPFVLALTDPETYKSQFDVTQATMIALGDINQDGVFDTADVAPFVQLLVGGDSTTVPEPGSLALLSLSGLLLLRRRPRR